MKNLLIIAFVVFTLGANAQTFNSFNLNLLGTFVPQLTIYSLDEGYNRNFTFHANTSYVLNDKLAFTFIGNTNRAYSDFYNDITITTFAIGFDYFWYADEKTQFYSGFNGGLKTISLTDNIGGESFDLGSAFGLKLFGARGTFYKSLGYFSELSLAAQPIIMVGLSLKY